MKKLIFISLLVITGVIFTSTNAATKKVAPKNNLPQVSSFDTFLNPFSKNNTDNFISNLKFNPYFDVIIMAIYSEGTLVGYAVYNNTLGYVTFYPISS